MQLGESVAPSRFIGIERTLRDENLHYEYSKFMKEYLELGHMREVTGEVKLPHSVYYLPHHAVLKNTSLTT